MRRWGLPARAPDLPDAPSREHGEADELTDLIKSARETDPDVPVSTRMVRENAVTALIQAARDSRMPSSEHAAAAVRCRSASVQVVQGLVSHSPTLVAVVPTA